MFIAEDVVLSRVSVNDPLHIVTQHVDVGFGSCVILLSFKALVILFLRMIITPQHGFSLGLVHFAFDPGYQSG